MNKDLDDHLTIDVAPDSLEAAIAGTRRGERWEDRAGDCLKVYDLDGDEVLCYERNKLGMELHRPALRFWCRVLEEPLTCPRCGGTVSVALYAGKWTCLCEHCRLRDGSPNAYPYPTEAEARAAWKRIGGKR